MRKIHRDRIKRIISQTALVLLLALYSAASLKIDSLHQLFHSVDLSKLHSAEQENNPCHKAIYHQSSNNEGDHESHISENEKCPLCEYNPSTDEFLIAETTLNQDFPKTYSIDNRANQFSFSFPLTFSLRGPPSIG